MIVYPTPTPAQLMCPHPLDSRRQRGWEEGDEWVCTDCEYEHVPVPDYSARIRELRRRERKAGRLKPCGACGKPKPRYNVWKPSPRDHAREAFACSELCAQAIAVRFAIEDPT